MKYCNMYEDSQSWQDAKSIRLKLEQAIHACAKEKFPKKFWSGYHIDMDDKKIFNKCLDIPTTRSKNGVYRVSIEDFHHIRVYPLDSVKKGVAAGSGVGAVVGSGGGVVAGAVIGSVVPVAGTIIGGLVGALFGAIGGAAAGGVTIGAAGAGIGAGVAYDKKVVIEMSEIFDKFPNYSKGQKKYYCDITPGAP